MGKPASHPLNIKIGDTGVVRVTLQDKNGDPIDITGRTYSAQVRMKANSATPLGTFVCSVVDGPAGKFQCTLPSEVTENFEPANAKWDLQEEYGDIRTTLISGDAIISWDVTR